MTNATNEWTAFVTELQQCAAGLRGWVSCTKARAKKMGIAHANLTIAATALGLTITTHGKYGYTASRSRMEAA